MNAKYSISRYFISALGAAAIFALPTACEDDFGYKSIEGRQIHFTLSAPDTWHNGMSIDENEPATHCTSVQALEGGDTQLYLHTVVADNPAPEKSGLSRGTPVKDKLAFQERYSRFSLSAICYTGEYQENNWTANFAHNLYYSTTTGKPSEGSNPLFWPSGGKVRFYAFAPAVEDFDKLETGGSLDLSDRDYKGSPTLTYEVPADVTKQIDLMTVFTNVTPGTDGGLNNGIVELRFGHALTAVQIKCGKDMLAGEITKVTIGGVYGKGRQVIGDSKWEPIGDRDASYTITPNTKLSADKDHGKEIHVEEGTAIAGTDTDNLTFMLLPQELTEDASMTIEFTDEATGTKRTLSGKLGPGKTWEAGKIVTYSVSQSSIHIIPKLKLDKKGATADSPKCDIIPYSGVWYDATYKATAEITQDGVAPKTIDIPAAGVRFEYSLGNEKWDSCTTDSHGLLTIAPQPAYATMNKGFSTDSVGSESSPHSLSEEYGETANCYLVDKAGYYSLPLVYGNGYVTLPANNPDGFIYFPKHDDTAIPAGGEITGVGDAVLCWQDAPDLIDSASVKVKNGNLVFRIRKHTLAQGNALVAVRDNTSDRKILWSWHIWVTPYKTAFYDPSQHYISKTYYDDNDVKTFIKDYEFAPYNLGWCDSHDHNEARTFSLRAFIDMSAYGGGTAGPLNIPGTFTQMTFRGSDAGDNTYYQWGRKDPMLGGIYNDYTPNYKYKKKGSSPDANEFTMENKQVFNQYNQDGFNYSFCKNPGDGIDKSHYASNGVTIGYSIQHPYMFVTNSRSKDGTIAGETEPDFNYRNHWHKPYAHYQVDYLNDTTHIMFNAWNAGATKPGFEYDSVFSSSGTIKTAKRAEYLVRNTVVVKSVYDPCPPKFKIPPIDAFRGIAKASSSNKSYLGLAPTSSLYFQKNAWTMTYNNHTITFPITGVRNYALRNNEWKTVEPIGSAPEVNHENFYQISMPAFKMLSFVSSATIVKKEDYNAYQLLIFAIDKITRGNAYSTSNIKMSCFTPSSNSYGLPVRPIADK